MFTPYGITKRNAIWRKHLEESGLAFYLSEHTHAHSRNTHHKGCDALAKTPVGMPCVLVVAAYIVSHAAEYAQ